MGKRNHAAENFESSEGIEFPSPSPCPVPEGEGDTLSSSQQVVRFRRNAAQPFTPNTLFEKYGGIRPLFRAVRAEF